jgi:hypothetical protein
MRKKILFSTENYDSVYDGPRPNGSDELWLIPEFKTPKIPLNLGTWNFFDEDGKIFDKERLSEQVFPKSQFFKEDTEWAYPHEIQGRKHLYLINVQNVDYFKNNIHIGFRYIHKDYIRDIKLEKCKIVILFNNEGTSGTDDYPDFEIVEKWRQKAGLPEYSIIFITGNNLGPEIQDEKGYKYYIIPYSDFELWNFQHTQKKIIDYIPADDKFLFLSYNRNIRLPRLYLLAKMLEQRILDRGRVSISKHQHTSYHNLSMLGEQYYKELADISPLTLNDDLNYNLASNVNIDDHQKTFISVVTESLVSNKTLFLSEKIWKPIQLGHPFMVLGNPGTLEFLKQQGYKTFSNWINEDYDKSLNFEVRANLICEELKRLSNLTLEEIISIRKEMEPILSYNLEVFKSNLHKNFDVDRTISTKLHNILQKYVD